MFKRVIIVLAGGAAAMLFISFGSLVATAETVDFQREVRPILASKCYACHGPDDQTREADLRLDVSVGNYAIAPGSRDDSELWARITSDDADLRMPPSESHEPLSKEQIETLGRWIDTGAAYQTHWSFELPTRPTAPEVAPIAEANGRIDHWIQAKLQASGLKPSPQADGYALVRRLYLDLTGIPPTPEQADRFAQDRSPVAYERLVDELLASPDYAERWARPWLDLARYADTNGYEKDRPRTIWPYRDWVLKAIAADMPFDEFSIRQLAGDMLPNASNDDLVATGFHRNTMLNEEGGIDPLEFRFHAMTDRVATTGLVWMGLTTGCAQCHAHKYDPITHRDYYAMMAIMNNADEVEQEIDAGQLAERRREIEAEILVHEDRWIDTNFAEKDVEATVDATGDSVRTAYQAWRDSLVQAATEWHVVRPLRMDSTSPNLALQDDGSILASGDVTKRDVYRFEFDLRREGLASLEQATAIRLEALPDDSLPAKGPGMAYYEGRRGDFFLSELTVQVNGTPVKLRDASHSYGKNGLGSGSTDAANVIDGEGSTGWSTAEAEGTANRWVANFDKPLALDQPIEITLVFERHYAAPLGRMRFSLARRDNNAVAVSLPAELESFVAGAKRSPDPVKSPAPVKSPELERELQRRFFQTAEAVKESYAPIAALRKKMPVSVRTLVMRERTQNDRETHRHHRGEYLQAREEVEPGILEAFVRYSDSLPTNRLEFARWLVSDANPLVGRVTVDRAWREFFGRGIVHTAGDYGTQSEPPSHPELLDELALDLTQSGWSIKRLHREIVMSATYRQSSHRQSNGDAQKAVNADPENRLLAIGPRRRLEAERLRDTMLAASGLVTRQFGGPSVYPPQPQSVTALAYGASRWPTSQGGDRYRRSVYTYAKRTAPFAAFTVFDGPTGELCLPRRDVSNSPLQSLTLMNDEMYVEIASMTVQAILRANGKLSEQEMALNLFRRFLTRKPDANEIESILRFYRSMPPDAGSDEARWKWVARALMNLDEAITTP